MRRFLNSTFGAIVTGLLLASAAPARAELRASARLAGQTLSAEDGQPVRGTIVTAEGGEPRVARTAVSQVDGAFRIYGLVPGRYHVKAQTEDGEPSPPVVVDLAEDGDAIVELTVPEPPKPAASVGTTSGGLLTGIPLWRRRLSAALRLSASLQATASQDADWSLQGLAFTNPVDGGPMVDLDLESMEALQSTDGLSEPLASWRGGAGASAVIESGSNKWEAGAVAGTGVPRRETRDPGTTATAKVTGPIVRERLWLNLTVGAERDRTQGGADGWNPTAATMTIWQLSPRNKIQVLGAHADARSFGGILWESLIADNVFGSLTASHFRGEGGGVPLDVSQAGGRLEVFANSNRYGNHELRFQGDVLRISSPGSASLDGATRARLQLHDSWRATRHTTIGGHLGRTRWDGDPSDVARTGVLAALSVALDATHDGRTAVRIRTGGSRTPEIPRPDGCPSQPTGCLIKQEIREAALGIDREVLPGLALGLEGLVRRRRHTFSGPAENPRSEPALALRLNKPGGMVKLLAIYQRHLDRPARDELTALAGFALGRSISIGTLVLYGLPSTWRPLFESEPVGFAPTNPDPEEERAWLLGLHVRAEIGSLTRQPTALWLDALNLLDVRTPTSAPLDRPAHRFPGGRQFRVGLRWRM